MNTRLDNKISVQLGRTELENSGEIDAQFGAPEELPQLSPGQPDDCFDAVGASETDETATTDD